ncbi:2353_t:CDS:2 [Racocetra fulgida]|uniref:2353_t:CDS:1 n=1 Tax=Racocetra fulgida TaxID=60492 RepID=A0A9N9BTL0_9GLOM|nr:2353_t:CDS:2 [Racocetra fulgida]
MKVKKIITRNKYKLPALDDGATLRQPPTPSATPKESRRNIKKGELLFLLIKASQLGKAADATKEESKNEKEFVRGDVERKEFEKLKKEEMKEHEGNWDLITAFISFGRNVGHKLRGMIAQVVPTEGAVAKAPTTTSVMAAKSPAYNSATVTSITSPTPLVPAPLEPAPLVPAPLVPTPLVPTPLVLTPLLAKEISNQVPPIGAVAVVKHTYPPINISEIEAAAVLIPAAAAGGTSNALNNPLLPFEQNTNAANSSVLQAAAGIGVGLAGVAASAIGAFYYFKNKDNSDQKNNGGGGNGTGKDDKDDDKPKTGIKIVPHGPSSKFVDPDDDNDATKSSAGEDTIFGSQAASTSQPELVQDTVGSVGMERHHSD